MDIPEPFLHIIRENYKRADLKRSDWIKIFSDVCFSQLINEVGIKESDYQARASKTGDMFEYIFWYIMKERFGIELQKDYKIPKACMTNGGELDFGIIKAGKVLCGIEAKGSASEIRNRYGHIETLKRPALKRTDTMKKGIAQAYQFKRIFPKVPFFVVTNVKPDSGNSLCMMKLSEGDIVDKFIDITNEKELDFFVNKLRKIEKSFKSWLEKC